MSEASQKPRPAPAIILVEPQLGENIGAAARAMANFGLTDLRLVAPRDGWPSKKARAAASGADRHHRRGARLRHRRGGDRRPEFRLRHDGAHPRSAEAGGRPARGGGRAARAQLAPAQATGILFGRERWGLTNEEVALADVIVTFPVNPKFASLNIAQAVLLMSLRVDGGGARRRAADARRRCPSSTTRRRRRRISSG